MKDDLVKRLREVGLWGELGEWCVEAANEIERLRDALHRISHAPHGKFYSATGHEEAFLIARAALARGKE